MHTLHETRHSDHDPKAVDIRVLGPVEVMVRARAVTLGGPRASRVLALLAMNCNTVVPHDWIVDALWDDPPPTVRQQVHNVVHGLRRALDGADGSVNVVRTGVGYQLEAEGSVVDALRFQDHARKARRDVARGRPGAAVSHLRDALAQWRGPALAGLADGRLGRIAALLDDQRLAVGEQLAELALAGGEEFRVVGELARLVVEHPYHEALRAALIKALRREGRQAEALAVYEQGCRLLIDELGLEPSPVLRTARHQVLQPRLDEPGPNFLPRDLTEFTGRVSETGRLTALAARSETSAPGIVTITGMGGVGKTALAVHAAHRLAADYPAGQFYVDLKGFTASAEPLDPGQALELLLRDVGVPAADLPSGLHGRSALWRSLLAGKRALVLLDNAVGPAQVRPLIPGSPRALVMVTSRAGLTSLEGSVPLALDMMRDAEGVQLFSTIAGPADGLADKAAVAAVVELCEGLPLAIGIAAARLRDRPHWSVSDLLDQLRATGCPYPLVGGDNDVLATIALSFAALTPAQRYLLGALSRSPRRSVDVRAVAVLCDMSPEEAAGHLEDLFDAALLQACTRGHYRLHRLVREAARVLAPDESELEHPLRAPAA
ncbi:AfsR/SARP family transcriptional regulator [Catenulispora subtropica]|uniref:Transcriptional regulator, SARP family n=1 Tax=Catenulispora subtropica TaxID=450798 RepID=A0ABN2SA87_9ACTN